MKPIVSAKSSSHTKHGVIAASFILLCTILLYIYSLSLKEEKAVLIKESLTVDPPRLSVASGFYKEPFSLEMMSINHAKVFYTLDGSEPTINSEQYREPIQVGDRSSNPNVLSEIKTSPVFNYPLTNVYKGTVVRAKVLVDDTIFSRETVATYFVHPKGRARYSVPVFSLVANPEDLFGYDKGIYVNGATSDDKDYYVEENISVEDFGEGFPTNYKRKGKAWERPVSLTLLESDGVGFTKNAGTRIHGNATRERPVKSLKFFFRSEYGDSVLNYPLYGSNGPEKFKSFLLRNGGQDMYESMFRDALAQSLVHRETALDLQQYRPTVLFINGEYWGIHNIRDRIDEYYFSAQYNIPLDSLVIIDHTFKPEFGDSSEASNILDILQFLDTSSVVEESTYKEILDIIDVDNFIDYIITEVYLMNSDWPQNNVNFWRYTGKIDTIRNHPKDGRWRWALYDLDMAFAAQSSVSTNSLKRFLSKNWGLSLLFNTLLEYEPFRNKFFDRFDYHLEVTFETKRVIATIDKMESNIAPEVQEHLDRWRNIFSYEQWQKNVDELRTFARERPNHQRKELELLKRQYE